MNNCRVFAGYTNNSERKRSKLPKSCEQMNSGWYRFKTAFFTILGDIKIFRSPFWVLYQPNHFRIKGPETRYISSIIEPGDVIMRAFINSLDDYIIPKGTSKCSHSGLYIGDGTVIHAIAEGAQEIDLIDFCRTDRIVVLRPCRGRKWAVQHARDCCDKCIPYDFDFKHGPGKYYCHELIAACFPNLDIFPLSKKILGIINSPFVYLADSFYTNQNFQHIYETNGNDGSFFQ